MNISVDNVLVLFFLVPACHSQQCRHDISSESGYIQSPNYPNEYEINTYCTWVISSPSGANLSLDFDYFYIDFSTNCLKESLIISDGNQQIAKGCGIQLHMKSFVSSNFKLVFTTDNLNEGRNGFHATFNAIPNNVQTTVDEVKMKSTTETGKHPEVRLSSTPTGDSLSPIAKIRDTTNRPRTAVVTQSTCESYLLMKSVDTLYYRYWNFVFPVSRISTVEYSTVFKDTTLDKPRNHGGVGTIIAASLGAGVVIVIVIGLLILLIKRKRSIPNTKNPSNVTDDSSRMYPIETSNIETHIESASPDSNDMPRNQDVYAVPMKKGFRKEEIYQESLTEYDSLHTSRPKMNGSGENNVYNMTTAFTDNVYGTNQKDGVMGNEYYDSMGHIAMSEPGGNELYDTAINNGYTSNDVIVSDSSYGTIL